VLGFTVLVDVLPCRDDADPPAKQQLHEVEPEGRAEADADH